MNDNPDKIKHELQKLSQSLPVMFQYASITFVDTAVPERAVIDIRFYNTAFYPTSFHHKPISKIIPDDTDDELL